MALHILPAYERCILLGVGLGENAHRTVAVDKTARKIGIALSLQHFLLGGWGLLFTVVLEHGPRLPPFIILRRGDLEALHVPPRTSLQRGLETWSLAVRLRRPIFG